MDFLPPKGTEPGRLVRSLERCSAAVAGRGLPGRVESDSGRLTSGLDAFTVDVIGHRSVTRDMVRIQRRVFMISLLPLPPD